MDQASDILLLVLIVIACMIAVRLLFQALEEVILKGVEFGYEAVRRIIKYFRKNS